jgi:hypothetical protein
LLRSCITGNYAQHALLRAGTVFVEINCSPVLKPINMLRSCALFALLLTIACSNDPVSPSLRYYEVGCKDLDSVKITGTADWRDTSFVVATADSQLIRNITEQLSLPVAQRKMVNGALVPGDGGYNRNGPHAFKWHLKEDDWQLTDVSAEVFDGRPYSDVDVHYTYWMDTVKRFAPWRSYIKREVTP